MLEKMWESVLGCAKSITGVLLKQSTYNAVDYPHFSGSTECR